VWLDSRPPSPTTTHPYLTPWPPHDAQIAATREIGRSQIALYHDIAEKGVFQYLSVVLKYKVGAKKEDFRREDLVFVSKHNPQDAGLDEAGVPKGQYILGVVDCPQQEMGHDMILTVRLDLGTAKGGTNARFSGALKSWMANAETWHVTKLCNLVTIIREYTALHMMPHYPLASKIIGASSVDGEAMSLAVPKEIEARLELDFNSSQRDAISAALRCEGFTLIQGPPGTGKSQTIFGLLMVLFNTMKAQPSEGELQAEENKKMLQAHQTHTKASGKKAKGAKAEEAQIAKLKSAMPWLSGGYSFDPLESAVDDMDTWDGDGFNDYQYGHTIPGLSGLNVGPYPRIDVVPLKKTSKVSLPKHILLTAPSNAAVDEVIERLIHPETGGIMMTDGKRWYPKVVRLGPNPRPSVMSVALETLVQKEGQQQGGTPDVKAIKSKIINQADIVATTLSCCGMGLLSDLQHGFDTVIIDEAAQAVEVSTLIPLRYNCVRCILLGDEKQLPATVFSKLAQTFMYQRSFFERLIKSGHKAKMLTTQYRMHPTIALFPCAEFYGGRLENAQSTIDRNRRELGSGPSALPIAPMRFFQVNGREEMGSSHSLYNDKEVEAIFHIFTRLLALSGGDENFGTNVGIIALYNEQVKRLRDRFKKAGHRNVDISTVDGFQGREKEIMFLSCVRGSNNEGGLGFLRDERRINVAITRARDALYVVGCGPTLAKHNQMWAKLIDSCKGLGVYIDLERKQKGKKRKASGDVSEEFLKLELDHLGMTNEEQDAFETLQEKMVTEARRIAAEEEEAQRAEEDFNEEGLDELTGTAASTMMDQAVDELDEGLGDMGGEFS